MECGKFGHNKKCWFDNHLLKVVVIESIYSVMVTMEIHLFLLLICVIFAVVDAPHRYNISEQCLGFADERYLVFIEKIEADF